MKPLNEVTSLSELWKHPEWKRRSKEFLKDKSCVWCGKKTGDTYIDQNGKKRKVGLSPHHVEKHKWGLPLYKQINTQMFNKWWKKHEEDHDYDLPLGLSKSEIKKQVKFFWSQDNRDKIKSRFEARKREIIDDYINLVEGKVIPFCGRCHYARKKGLVICPMCKENYCKPRNKYCRECKDKMK